MMSQFESRGYRVVDFNGPADLYIVNTCTVTHLSDRKSRQMLRRGKRINPEARVVAVGCYPQVNEGLVAALPEVDLFLGNLEKARIVDWVEKALSLGERVRIEPIHQPRPYSEMTIRNSHEKTRAFIKIQDGCDQFCSYCIIPYARGRSRSRLPAHVVEEVRALNRGGYREVVLTGIHLGSYGKDLGDFGLLDLLRVLHEETDIERIRLGSLEPGSIPEDITDWPERFPRLCPHFHLSLQSGSSGVLRRMNRHYTPEVYARTVRSLRDTYPLAGITTDVIAGFVGETEAEFQETRDFLAGLGLSAIHVFKYSDREGTRASKMPGKVAEGVKTRRSAELIQLAEASKEAYLKWFVGREVRVLFETLEEGRWSGHTEEYLKVSVAAATDSLVNRILKVRIAGVAGEMLVGEITK